jgi:flagellar hook assembly protein FlgD
MELLSNTSHAPDLVKRTSTNTLVFNSHVAEITILDRRGKVLWHKKQENLEPIQWNGIDVYGDTIEVGQYTCKVVYQDRQAAYLPFVLMK